MRMRQRDDYISRKPYVAHPIQQDSTVLPSEQNDTP